MLFDRCRRYSVSVYVADVLEDPKPETAPTTDRCVEPGCLCQEFRGIGENLKVPTKVKWIQCGAA